MVGWFVVYFCDDTYQTLHHPKLTAKSQSLTAGHQFNISTTA
jgi:hypothetical protein